MTDSWDHRGLCGPGEGAEVSSFMREHRVVGSTAHAGTCELTYPHKPGRRGYGEGRQIFYLCSLFGLEELEVEERIESLWKFRCLYVHYNRTWSSKGT